MLTDAPTPSTGPDWQRPSTRLRTVWRAGWLAGLTALTLVAALLARGSGALVAGCLVSGAAAMAAAWWLAGRRYDSLGWAERGEDLLVRSGFLVHHLRVVPYGRMQYVDVVAGPVDRRLGLASVQLHTAAAASDAAIPGVPASAAERLRDRLAALGEARQAGL